MRIVPRLPIFSSVQTRQEMPPSASFPNPSSNFDFFQRSQANLVSPNTQGKRLLFGSLIKLSGTGAYQDKKGILHHSLQDALEFAKLYEESPAEFALGYYQDPEKPDNVWMADDDSFGIHADKTTLDVARMTSPEEFKKTFNRIKKDHGTKNFIRRPNEPIAWGEERVNKGLFVKISGAGAQKTEDGSLRHTLAEALEFASYYENEPAHYQLGYYQDPQKPDNVWMAEGDAKFLLDRARREKLPLEFDDTFKMLKKTRVQEETRVQQALSNLSISRFSLSNRSNQNG